MNTIANEHFKNETIVFDGFSFIGCTFTNCVIIITTLDFNFHSCSFFESNLHVNPELSIFEISHKLSQSTYDHGTNCYRNDYKYPRTALDLPTATVH
ncbi:Pentapeptide repeat-containing protein [Paenibacillus alkaliterrae]